MQQPTQRQKLEELLARLEFKQRLIQRKIISTQVQLELLNQRERNLTNNLHNTQHHQQTTNTNQYNNNNTSSNEDSNSNTDNNQDSDNSASAKEENMKMG